MSPDTLRIDRVFRGLGRIAKASGTTDPRTFRQINRMLTALYEDGRLDVLKAIRDGDVTPLQAYDAFRRRALDTLPLGETIQTIGAAMQAWVDAPDTARDYSPGHLSSLRQSVRYIKDAAPAHALVNDLPTVMESMRKTLGVEHPRSFNVALDAAGAFVRKTLKRSHPLWAKVRDVEKVKVRASEAHRPMEPHEFFALFPHPETDAVDAIAWSMAMTGMYQGELWAGWSVGPDLVHVRGMKRTGRNRYVPLIWTPQRPTMHRRTFENKIRDRTDAIVPRDLRRTYAHWLELAGIDRSRRKQYMGHTPTDVTDLYEIADLRPFLGPDAAAIRKLLGLPTERPMLRLHNEGGA